MNRKNIKSGAPWESIAAYSRAVRVGNTVHVSGTTSTDKDGNLVGKGDIYRQTIQIFRNIELALVKAGATLKDVVRTRVFVTDISQFEDVARAYREWFDAIRPAMTLVEVSKLVSPDMLIEIEAVAIIS